MRQLSILLYCALALILVGCKSEQEIESEAPAVPVTASAPVIKDLTVYLNSIGTLQAAVSIDIRPQVSGRLAKVLIREGDWVEEGISLFQIDPSHYIIKVQEAQALLEMDQADHLAVQKKLERFKELARKDLVAQTEWDDLNAQAQKAQASMNLSEARLNAAKLDLAHCTIDSPISGRIGKLDAHPGILVSSGQNEALATLVKMDPLIVEFTITEKEFPKISPNKRSIEMVSLCDSNLCSHGVVTFLDNQFDHKTGLLLIRGEVPNPDYTLRPGQSMKVKIPVAISTDAKLIPQKAIRYNQEGPYVYVVQADQTVALRPLILGDEHEKDQIVLEGLDPGEVVVIDGHLRLSPGLKVEIKT